MARTRILGTPSGGASRPLPAIVDAEADRSFREGLRAAGFAPDDRFSDGYVDWEWRHSRHLFEELPFPVRGARVLELGCHLGATAVVLALLGAEVTAVDVRAQYLPLARANAARFGLQDRIRFAPIDGHHLPLGTGACDLVTCNSVLEYVAPMALRDLQGEIGRVLRPGGLVAVLGTSNRLWPREVHSGQWLSNYVPRWLDHLVGRVGQRLGRALRLRRGLTAWQIRRGFPGYVDLFAGDPWRLVRLKSRMGASAMKVRALALMTRLLSPAVRSLGALLPTITMLLEKPRPAARSSSVFA